MPLIPPISQNPSPLQGEETLVSKPTLVQSLPFTAYDVEDLSPLGTSNNPLDTPKLGTNQITSQPKWSPSSTYLDSIEGAITSPDSSAEKNNFKTSALDLENPLAGARQGGSGGPNRTNAIQSKNGFNSGQYTVIRAGGMGFSSTDAGGSVVTQTLHAYTPTNPYFQAGPPIPSPYVNNVALPNNADGPHDATIK